MRCTGQSVRGQSSELWTAERRKGGAAYWSHFLIGCFACVRACVCVCVCVVNTATQLKKLRACKREKVSIPPLSSSYWFPSQEANNITSNFMYIQVCVCGDIHEFIFFSPLFTKELITSCFFWHFMYFGDHSMSAYRQLPCHF